MRIRPNYQDSIADQLRKEDVKRPVAIPANEQLTTETRELDNMKGVNLAVTSSDPLRTVLEELSHLRVWATKTYRGEVQDTDKNVVQTRIDQIKEDIKNNLANTEFNKVKNLESRPEGNRGQTMKLRNTSLETLGIEKFSVLNESSVKDIDKAIALVKNAVDRPVKRAFRVSANAKFSQQARSTVLNRQDKSRRVRRSNFSAQRESLVRRFRNIAAR